MCQGALLQGLQLGYHLHIESKRHILLLLEVTFEFSSTALHLTQLLLLFQLELVVEEEGRREAEVAK